MKKLLLLVLFIVLVCFSAVQARPFLACDIPAVAPDSYLVTLNTGEEIETPYPLYYDLVDLAPGEYVVTVRANYTLWGVSDPSVPLNFTKPVLTPLTGLGIVP